MTHYESPLAAAAKGAIAGLADTVALTIGMRAPQLLQQGKTQPQKEPTAKLAGKVAGGVFEQALDRETKATVGEAIHWSYGAGWGALYGLAQESLRLPRLVHGTVFGLLVATVASTLVPSMGLTPPPTKQPPEKSMMQLALHLVYGWVTVLVFHRITAHD